MIYGFTCRKFSVVAAIANLKAIASLTERPDWSGLNLLDFGCGVKFTQALIQYSIGLHAYVGLDVYQQMIKFLTENVKNPGFFFHHVPFKNEMYNPDGIELTAESTLPGDITAYDLITLQSVFTHFNPADFLALLHVLRRYAAHDSRMLFTCFIDNDLKEDFVDLVPEKPLLKAYYKERYIREMLEQTHWKPLLLKPPGSMMMHHFVCEPC